MVTMRWDFSKLQGRFSIQSVTLRETNGEDELEAEKLAEIQKTSMRQELVRASIVKVNDMPVTQPYAGLDGWNTKTRSTVVACWIKLNGISDKDAQDFLASGEIQEDSPDTENVAPLFGANG